MNIEKLIQAVGYLVQKNGGAMNYLKLIKILYLADKESFCAINRPVTGDTYVAMKHGPVLSALYALITGEYKDKAALCAWQKSFEKNGYDLVLLTSDIQSGELSRFETGLLDKLDTQFKQYTQFEMIEYVHDKKNCPEWKPSPRAKAIPKKAVLRSIGRSNEEIADIMSEERQYKREEKILSSLSAVTV